MAGGASSGGVLRYSILIEAIDKASGRLNAVTKNAQRTRDALAFPSTGASSHLKSQVKLYSELTQQTQKYSVELENLMRKQGKGFMADIYKAQHQDATKMMHGMEQGMTRMSSIFKEVNQKNLAEHKDLMKGMRVSSRGMSKAFFDEKGWKSSEPKRKQMKSEITKFFKDIQKSPLEERGTFDSIFDRWAAQMKKMSAPMQGVVSQAFKKHVGIGFDASHTDRAVAMHQKQLAQLHTDVTKAADSYGNLNKQLEATKTRLKGFSVLFFQVSQFVKQAMVGTRPMAEAMAFSGQDLTGRTPFSFTNMGATVTDMGNIYRAAARSPYESEMLQNQFAITNYTNLFDTQPKQFVPMLTGMRTLFGDNMSMSQQIGSLTGLQMKSNMDLGGFFSMYMMGAIPQLSSMDANMNETLALIGAVSNQGLGSFAGRHVGTALQSLTNPSKKSQEFQSQFGFDFQKIIREYGILDALQMINEELDTLTAPERTKAMAEMFPGRGQGPMEIMLKSVEQAKKMNRELGSMLETARGIEEASQHGYFRIQQMSSALSNVPTGILYGLAETASFKGFIKTATDVAAEFNRFNDSMAEGKPSMRREGVGAAGGVASMMIPAILGARALNFLPQLGQTGMQLQQLTSLQHAAELGNWEQHGALKSQFGAQTPRSFLGITGSGVMKGLGAAVVLSAIYMSLKSLSNATIEHYKKRNKEDFVDPIVKLSIADIEGAREGNEEAMRDLRNALMNARTAIDMNTTTLKKGQRGQRIMNDYELSQMLLKTMSGESI